MCNDVEAKGSKQIIINALSLYTLSMAFFLFSINYMVKFACKRNFRAFSLEINILLLPFCFEFLVLQECKVVFREYIILEHKLFYYIYIYTIKIFAESSLSYKPWVCIKDSIHISENFHILTIDINIIK